MSLYLGQTAPVLPPRCQSSVLSRLFFRGVNQATALLEAVLGMHSSNWEKPMARACSGNAGKPAHSTGCRESSSSRLQTSYRNNQHWDSSLSWFIYFLLSSREVENMIEAERPSVSTVLGLFCTWIGVGRGGASHRGKPTTGNRLQPHNCSLSINSHIFSSSTCFCSHLLYTLRTLLSDLVRPKRFARFEICSWHKDEGC